MHNYFEVKVRFEKLDQTSGKSKKVTEPYIIDAVTFTEAEASIYTKLEELISGEFKIKAISQTKITDIFEYESGEYWFKCTVVYLDVDEDSGKEKKVSVIMLVSADDVREAYERTHESLKDMVVPFEVKKVEKSNIADVFPYQATAGFQPARLPLKKATKATPATEEEED